MNVIESGCIRVRPVLVRPSCYEEGREQDCLRCGYGSDGKCLSTMRLCAAQYPGHRKGCPNYGRKDDCPPNMPMLDEVFDLTKPVYCIYTKFDMEEHTRRMRLKHPHWSDRQCRCCLYWQNDARKKQKAHAFAVYQTIKTDGLFLTDTPEAMGVDVTKTLQAEGVFLEWPCVHHVYKISFAGVVRESIVEGKRIRGRQVAFLENGFLVIKKP